MNTSTDHDPPRVFGARAAALTGLLIAIGTGAANEARPTDTGPEFVIAEGPHINPSTCCGRLP
jgi:hypothetical protein